MDPIARFLLYIEKVLVPTLRFGDIVVMDNLGSHKARRCAAPYAPSAQGSSSWRNTGDPTCEAWGKAPA